MGAAGVARRVVRAVRMYWQPPRRRRRRGKRRARRVPWGVVGVVAVVMALWVAGRARVVGDVPRARARPLEPPRLRAREGPPQFGARADGGEDALYGRVGVLEEREGDGDADADGNGEEERLGLPRERRASAPDRPQRARSVAATSGQYTRTCYHSSHSGDALCVHVPFCVRHTGIVYIADELRCADYTNVQGVRGALSKTRCVELERSVEAVGEIEAVEQKPRSWLGALESEDKIQWFEGDTVFIRATSKHASLSGFAQRIFMLHHVLRHPERYGMGAVSNVVIAADRGLSKKLRYSKSWHHGLLAAIVHPNKIIYSHHEAAEAVSRGPPPAGTMRVFVPTGLEELAKGRYVPCFRRAALTGAVSETYFMPEDVFPGTVKPDSAVSETRYADAAAFRELVYQSLGHTSVPRLEKRVVYLHKEKVRAFSESGLDTVEEAVRRAAATARFQYKRVNIAGMTFPQQVEAVADAGVVVGVHGTQLLPSLFLTRAAAMVELFPYKYSSPLYVGGSGAGVHYSSHSLVRGVEFEGLGQYADAAECIRANHSCRAWYRSDDRALEPDELDAATITHLVEKAALHVAAGLAGPSA